MRVERVEALGFGPFSGAALHLGEGMTLVFGRNEAGKSSWHGALYAGLCGVRRGKGRRSASDEEFARRHRPWAGGPWQVRAMVALDDGRRFELTQDLEARSGTARDYATGREVTRDILTDQTPDAARWLGLDRDAFKAVACVPQTALLQILDQPALLAGHLQRAAATAGTDATAAEAIRRIDEFLGEHVGTDRAYTRPLARAKARLREAEETLRRAERAHADMAGLRQELRAAAQAEQTAWQRLRCAEAAEARRRADAAQDDWKRAADLAARYPGPPPSLADDDTLAQQARGAVDGYRARPAVPVLAGPSAADLETELAGLPELPAGDRRPAAEAEAAYEAVRQERAKVAALEPGLTPPRAAAAGGSRPDAGRTRGRRWPAVATATAVLLVLAGAAIAAGARQPLGWAVAAAGAVLGAAVVISLSRDRDQARARAATAQHTAQDAAWEQRRKDADAALGQSLSRLAEALRIRGAAVTGNPEADFEHYRRECDAREERAAQASRRADLRDRLNSRRVAEAQAADAALRRSGAEQAVRAAAGRCRIDGAGTRDLDALAAALESWLDDRQQALDQRQQDVGGYAVLQQLLAGGRTPQDLREDAERLAAAADRAAADLDPAGIAAASLGPDPAGTLQELRAAAHEAGTHLAALEERAQERQRGAPSVAAGQEAAAQAAGHVRDLERLGRVLGRAREFLVQAQDNVHRSIAPQLADAIAPQLAAITGGRYTEVLVDPDDLQVRVRAGSGTWREAARLSHGTAEQVYLLLRAALARYLATTGEPCPLILDDPAAYADTPRTTAVLEALHGISAERQVVIFSHDPQVLAWAQRALASPRDKVIELSGSIPA